MTLCIGERYALFFVQVIKEGDDAEESPEDEEDPEDIGGEEKQKKAKVKTRGKKKKKREAEDNEEPVIARSNFCV